MVTLHSLRAHRLLNGMQGVVQYFDPSKPPRGQYAIALVSKTVWAGATHLTYATPEDAAAAHRRRANAAASTELAPPGAMGICLRTPRALTGLAVVVMHSDGWMLVGEPLGPPRDEQQAQGEGDEQATRDGRCLMPTSIPAGRLPTDKPLREAVNAVLTEDVWLTLVDGAAPTVFLRGPTEGPGGGCVYVHVPLARLRSSTSGAPPRLTGRRSAHVDALGDHRWGPRNCGISGMLREVVTYDRCARDTGVAGLPWCLPTRGPTPAMTPPVPPAQWGGPGREVTQIFPTAPAGTYF